MGFWIRTAEEKAERGRKKFAAGNKLGATMRQQKQARFYNADGSRRTLKESVTDRPKSGVELWADAGKAKEEARWERVKAEKAAKKGK